MALADRRGLEKSIGSHSEVAVRGTRRGDWGGGEGLGQGDWEEGLET